MPIPRGAASKKRRISEEDATPVGNELKQEFLDGALMNGNVRHRNSLPNALDMTNTSELQDLAYSAQQVLGEVQTKDLIPIDPALQSYDHQDDTIMADTSPQSSHRDAIMSSIENVPYSLMKDAEMTAENEQRGPSVEPLTPGPAMDGIQDHLNGVKQTHSPPEDNYTVSNTISVAPPPRTPNAARSIRMPSSSHKPNQTPRSANRKSYTPKSTPGGRRRDSKESIKLEQPRFEHMARATSSAAVESEEDMASLALAMKLQMEEHGLRRRSK